jgi:hypothetical protein
MPDDHHPLMPRPNPEDIDLGAIKADLEFLIEQVTRFRKEQALKPLYTMIGSAAIVIAWIELFWRHCSDPCRSFGASRQSRRYSPSFSLPRGKPEDKPPFETHGRAEGGGPAAAKDATLKLAKKLPCRTGDDFETDGVCCVAG